MALINSTKRPRLSEISDRDRTQLIPSEDFQNWSSMLKPYSAPRPFQYSNSSAGILGNNENPRDNVTGTVAPLDGFRIIALSAFTADSAA